MRIPTFATRMHLNALSREVRYTLVQLRLRPWAKSWVPTFSGLLKEVDDAEFAHRQLTYTLEEAEAGVDYADEVLDVELGLTANTARIALKGEVLAAFMSSLFGSAKPSDLVRNKLGAQLERMRTWPAILQDAPATALKELIPRVAAAVEGADAANQALSEASGALEAFRASVQAPLIEKTNGERKALGGDAKRQRHDADGGSIEEGLFLVSAAASRRSTRVESVETLQAEVAALQVELGQAQQRLTERLAQDEAQAQAAQGRKEVEQKVQELEKSRAQAAAQIAELQAQLAGA